MKRSLTLCSLIAVVACGSSNNGTTASATSATSSGTTVGATTASSTGRTTSGTSSATASSTGNASTSGTTSAAASTTGSASTTAAAATSGATTGSTTAAATTVSATTGSTSGSTTAAATTSGTTGSGGTTGNATTSGTTGGTTGGTTSGNCAATEFGGDVSNQGGSNTCNSAADCNCGQLCVDDAILGSVCETLCDADTQCLNVASSCVDGFCQPNYCTSGAAVGSTCLADNGITGTCVPVTQAGIQICMPVGLGPTCTQNSDDNPYLSNRGYVIFVSPQTASDGFCPSGEACDFGTCATLCKPGTFPCPEPQECISVDPEDTSWGFCGACAASGAGCNVDSDCCGDFIGACVGGNSGQPGTCS